MSKENTFSGASVISGVLTILLAIFMICNISQGYAEERQKEASKRTASIVAPATFCNSSYNDGWGSFTCRLVTEIEGKPFTFYFRVSTHNYKDAMKLQGIETVLEGTDFIIDYEPSNPDNFTARPAGYNSIWDIK